MSVGDDNYLKKSRYDAQGKAGGNEGKARRERQNSNENKAKTIPNGSLGKDFRSFCTYLLKFGKLFKKTLSIPQRGIEASLRKIMDILDAAADAAASGPRRGAFQRGEVFLRGAGGGGWGLLARAPSS